MDRVAAVDLARDEHTGAPSGHWGEDDGAETI